MSVSTSFKLLNSNDPKFISAKNGDEEQKEKFEDYWGNIEYYEGQLLDIEEDKFVEEGEEEYGSWTIDLSKLPKEATYVYIYRC